MRVRKISGTYVKVCKRLIQAGATIFKSFIADQTQWEAQEQVYRDLHRISMLGTLKQKMALRKSWSGVATYTQGDESGANLLLFLEAVCPRVAEEDSEEERSKIFKHSLRCCYWSDENQAAGFALLCRIKDPSCWMMSTITNATATLDKRMVTLYFSEALYEKFPLLQRMVLQEVDLYEDLELSLQSEETFSLLENTFTSDEQIDEDEVKRIDALAECFGNPQIESDVTYLKLFSKRESLLNLKDSLSQKKLQIYDHLMELMEKALILEKSGYKDDAVIANDLATELFNKSEQYFENTEGEANWKDLRNECKLIVNEAKENLMFYESWEIIISNFLLAVTGLCLLKAAFTSNFFLHNSGEACYEEIQSTYSLMKNLDSCSR